MCSLFLEELAVDNHNPVAAVAEVVVATEELEEVAIASVERRRHVEVQDGVAVEN